MPRIDESQFSVKDLVELDLIKKDGRPTENMTDKIWQPIFNNLKEKNIPFIDGETKRMKCKYIIQKKDEYNGGYIEEVSQYQRYCAFINGVLRDIRKHKVAYCYYIHQVIILLRFHPTIKSRFVEFYWEVYLDDE